MMTEAELKAVDHWAFERRIRSRGEALRQLIALGLKESKSAGPNDVAPHSTERHDPAMAGDLRFLAEQGKRILDELVKARSERAEITK